MDPRHLVRAGPLRTWCGAGVAAALALLTGCAATQEQAGPTPAPVPTAEPGPPTTGPDPTEPDPATGPPTFPGPDLPPATAEPQDVATNLVTPWSVAFLPGGGALVTSRDTAQVLLIGAEGTRPLTGAGADELAATTERGGEGGLLGAAVGPDVSTQVDVYLYRTTASGNEVVRAALGPDGTLGPLSPVVTGIPAAGNHNGGRIAFGPDGHLYIGTGDAGTTSASQDPSSLAGKILRVTVEGEPAPGNPTPGSPVHSLGHRNVQGLGWADDGRLIASELGQNAYDELNVIVPGGNYGWPEVEGRSEAGTAQGFIDPVLTWSPGIASPSGLAVTDLGVYVAALRGQRLWEIGFEPGAPEGLADAGDTLVGELGRLRDVVVAPDGALWVLTSNTDGRGAPGVGDDRVVRLLPP